MKGERKKAVMIKQYALQIRCEYKYGGKENIESEGWNRRRHERKE